MSQDSLRLRIAAGLHAQSVSGIERFAMGFFVWKMVGVGKTLVAREK